MKYQIILLLSATLLIGIACSNTEPQPTQENQQVDITDDDGDSGHTDTNGSGNGGGQDGSDDDDQTDESNDSTIVEFSILFVGNSLTIYNNLPELVKEKAKEEGVELQTVTLAQGGYAIGDHWADGEVQELIKSQEFDYVIIQQGPSSQQDGYDMLVNDGKLYKDICEENGAQLAYFMVWPSRAYYHTFPGVIANYTAGANANNAILCPVGQVWKDYFDSTGDYTYYGPDQFHPSLKGSRVAADVIFESLGLK